MTGEEKADPHRIAALPKMRFRRCGFLGDVPFDTFGVDFGHHGDDCTFETLRKAFGLDAPGLDAVARIVHDADMKDGKFGRRDTQGIEKAIRALSLQLSDDRLIEVGMLLFDGLLEITRGEGLP